MDPKKRRKLLEVLVDPVTITIPPLNNDIPNFLEKLRVLKEQARETKFTVKYQTPQPAY